MGNNRDSTDSATDLRNIYKSLRWLKQWAERRIGSINFKDKNTFLIVHEDELVDCPKLMLGLYALEVLRSDILRRLAGDTVEICVGRLAELNL